MKKQSTRRRAIKFSVIFSLVAALGTTLLINACNKANKQTVTATQSSNAVENRKPAPVVQNNTITQVTTVADMRKSADGSYTIVCFHGNAEVFHVQDASVIASLQNAFSAQKTIKINFNPWSATVLGVADATNQESVAYSSREIVYSPGIYTRIAGTSINPDVLNNTPEQAVLNTTTGGLINVVPDMATAQSMFDYISHQCCAIGGPILIDYCIPFQYCEDGCYARAHKMCWIINNTFHYGTHKIFSFAYHGGTDLCVKAEKWRGCCINWWYHVAPLLNIKTPSGIKAYVFDPAMFDQPVLLATWLHAQENPSCGTPGITSINIQPTSSYSPIDTAHFDTDPSYSSTDGTLIGYASLRTCP